MLIFNNSLEPAVLLNSGFTSKDLLETALGCPQTATLLKTNFAIEIFYILQPPLCHN